MKYLATIALAAIALGAAFAQPASAGSLGPCTDSLGNPFSPAACHAYQVAAAHELARPNVDHSSAWIVSYENQTVVFNGIQGD